MISMTLLQNGPKTRSILMEFSFDLFDDKDLSSKKEMKVFNEQNSNIWSIWCLSPLLLTAWTNWWKSLDTIDNLVHVISLRNQSVTKILKSFAARHILLTLHNLTIILFIFLDEEIRMSFEGLVLSNRLKDF